MKVMQPAYTRAEDRMGGATATLMVNHGVPTGIDEAFDLADDLYPLIMAERALMIVGEAEALATAHPFIVVNSDIPYPLTATRKLVVNAAGLAPKPRLTRVEMYDPKTQRMQVESIAPWTMPDSDEVKDAFLNRVGAASARHVKAASRDLVVNTAVANRAGWARQLSGAENCPFCAMLASRGAVYSKESVKFTAHDHCDCSATLVDKSGDFEGKDQADALYRLWKASKDMVDFGDKFRGEFGFVGMAAT